MLIAKGFLKLETLLSMVTWGLKDHHLLPKCGLRWVKYRGCVHNKNRLSTVSHHRIWCSCAVFLVTDWCHHFPCSCKSRKTHVLYIRQCAVRVTFFLCVYQTILYNRTCLTQPYVKFIWNLGTFELVLMTLPSYRQSFCYGHVSGDLWYTSRDNE